MKEITSSISWNAFFMKHVYLVASKSKDPRTKIGAVLVKDGIIISEGYNGFARGVKDYEERYINRKLKLKFVVHAECNAILNAVRHGINTSNSICYTQTYPCCDCSKTLIQAGIQEIVIHKPWKMSPTWEESSKIGREMFFEAGISIKTIDDFLDVVAYADGSTVIL
jgi:dCMP deaminase